jgi:hypothetical protein
MRSRLATRPARLVLAAAAVTALAAVTTACDPQDSGATGAAAPSSAAASSPAASSGPAGSSGSSATNGSGGDAAKSGGSSGSGGAANAGDDKGYGQYCGSNDLVMTISKETQAGGFFLITAKAKPGITCYLDDKTPSVAFGSGADGVATSIGGVPEHPIKLSGATAAYFGVSPKTTNNNDGKQFETMIVAVPDNDPNPAELTLPDPTVVDKAVVTPWVTASSDALPIV